MIALGKSVLCVVPLALIAACSTPAPSGFDNHWEPSDPSQAGQANLTPLPVGHQPRRLSVAQLDRTLQTVFGRPWNLDGTQVPVLPFLTSILGQPDYLSENIESLDATPVFAKFMDNMASKMCFDATMEDYNQSNAEQRLIARYPDDVAKNLRYLRLRLHGIYVPPTESMGLQALTELHDTLDANAPVIYGETFQHAFSWIGVCVAMVTDPEFMIY